MFGGHHTIDAIPTNVFRPGRAIYKGREHTWVFIIAAMVILLKVFHQSVLHLR